jgi:hypothetical protein
MCWNHKVADKEIVASCTSQAVSGLPVGVS